MAEAAASSHAHRSTSAARSVGASNELFDVRIDSAAV